MPNRYVALLRGVNVGGKNAVAMPALREAFEKAGYGSVRTYINSGNVLFESGKPRAALEDDLERVLAKRFSIPLTVVVRSQRQLRGVVSNAPDGFGTEPRKHHYDVVYLKSPLTAARARKAVQLRDGVDEVWTGPGLLYFSRLTARLVQSKINKIASTPEYKQMTIRSWSTTTKLVGLLDDHPA